MINLHNKKKTLCKNKGTIHKCYKKTINEYTQWYNKYYNNIIYCIQ